MIRSNSMSSQISSQPESDRFGFHGVATGIPVKYSLCRPLDSHSFFQGPAVAQHSKLQTEGPLHVAVMLVWMITHDAVIKRAN